MKRLPVLPTILVLAAVATMIGLGIWQLGRKDEKEALLARYEAASESQEMVPFPVAGKGEAVWFRRSVIDCQQVIDSEPVAGTAANGAKGWAMRVTCEMAGSDAAVTVDLGFARDLAAPEWQGGMVSGVIAPGPRLVADPPIADLAPLAAPDPADLPNNHLAYAGQWFFFALTALVIYALALRTRLKGRNETA
ncbi:SURF1 family cytochrome oxidase biogenesis protein [Erythrobacter sp.]|uniref:SURF1 family cytochrome oxidase biogenesis protein n=1 Tax=Erythrobacter sp. TaxID=1042 RepID=UPI001425EF17|nr:SURF1 family cytochrome oxidase biogenesis protein [Erythrobacter sp.]QIQ86663.1 MAG: SURF1 family protein [Erythrobacter sp.]